MNQNIYFKKKPNVRVWGKASCLIHQKTSEPLAFVRHRDLDLFILFEISRCLFKNISIGIFCNILILLNIFAWWGRWHDGVNIGIIVSMKILIATIFWSCWWRCFIDDDDSAKTRSELRGVSYRRFFSCPPIGRWPASTLICKKLNLKSFWKYHETWHSSAFKERQWQTYGWITILPKLHKYRVDLYWTLIDWELPLLLLLLFSWENRL